MIAALGPMTRALATTLFFVALTTFITWPQARDLAGTAGLHGDALFSVWRLAWIAHQLPRDPAALFDANIFWPVRNTLAFSDAILLPGALLAPAHWLGAPPLVVYNVFLLASYVLCGVAMCALVRRLTVSWLAGLLAGVSFAFCTHRLEHFERLELLTSFWMPWCLLALHKGARGEGARWFLVASVLAAAQVLTGIYHGIFLLTFIAVLAPLLLWRQPRRIPAVLAMTLVLPALVLAAYSRPYMANRQQVGERRVAEVQCLQRDAGELRRRASQQSPVRRCDVEVWERRAISLSRRARRVAGAGQPCGRNPCGAKH